MKTLFLDLSMGAAGDMLVAAVLPLLKEQEAFFAALRQFEDLGVKISFEPARSMGIWGYRFNVLVHEAMEESIDVDAAGQPLAANKGYVREHRHTHSEHTHDHAHAHEHPEHSHGHAHGHGSIATITIHIQTRILTGSMLTTSMHILTNMPNIVMTIPLGTRNTHTTMFTGA